MLLIVFVLFFVFALIKWILSPKRKKSIDGRHIAITGGSSGIGKALAVIAAQKGAHVTIIARNLARLKEAKEEIINACVRDDQIITALPLDVSVRRDVFREVENLEKNVGPVFMLVNCAGMAICRTVEDYTQQDIQTMLNANYLGTLYPIQAIVPRLKARKEGVVVLTGSPLSLMGIYGGSVYASFKFALRGLAESIAMELKPYKVSVTLALPPDTDTPGYQKENEGKPEEMKLISASAGLLRPETVAETLLKHALEGKFFSYVGFESWLLTNLCVGMAPIGSLLQLIVQSLVLGPIRLISGYYVHSFEKIVDDCYQKKQKTE